MRPWIKRILLDGESHIALEPGQVLALVGPNNSGKTHFLRQLLSQLYGGQVNEQSPHEGLITELELDWTLSEPHSIEDQLVTTAHNLWEFRDPNFFTHLPERFENAYGSYTVDDIRLIGKQMRTLGPFVEHYTRWDEPHSRIVESEKQQLGRSTTAAISLTQNESERAEAVTLFEEVFDETLSVYDLREGDVGFLLAEAPEGLSAATKGLDEETKKFMRESPKLWFQGSGMRNVFGLLARIISDDRSIVIMDEPEAFLHPNQAWKLGFVLARVCRESSKQLICATHDRHFIDGLAQGAQEQLRICRLDNESTSSGLSYTAYQVPSSFWSTMRDKSRVRYSNVLECLFSNHVILVEGESDALFYQETLEFAAAKDPEIARILNELIFLPTSGNSEFAPMIRLVKEMGPHVSLIGDLDLIANEERFEATINSVTGHVPTHLKEARKKIEELFDKDLQSGENDQDTLIRKLRETLTTETISDSARSLWTKHIDQLDKKRNDNRKNQLQRRIARRANLRTNDPAVKDLIQDLLCDLDAVGVFLVPWGELEHFDEELLKKGKQDWVRNALDAGVHKASRAQNFASKVLDFIRQPERTVSNL